MPVEFIEIKKEVEKYYDRNNINRQKVFAIHHKNLEDYMGYDTQVLISLSSYSDKTNITLEDFFAARKVDAKSIPFGPYELNEIEPILKQLEDYFSISIDTQKLLRFGVDINKIFLIITFIKVFTLLSPSSTTSQ